ncbi:uncharacterized protein LOC141855024 [Brevipalpus obovatus]|uniref:uncharacterized protein LOC141855024 n=1 Tax=Brevipalpus obovatus TaxID=246614 RepID=UPI003D9F088B
MKFIIPLTALFAVTIAGIVPVQYGQIGGGSVHYAPQGGSIQYTRPAAGGLSQLSRNEDGLGNYQFAYQETHETGGSARQEQRDASGNVAGSYSLVDADGRQRTVRYIADEFGFRASVLSNEPGVADASPAGVNMKGEEIPAPVIPSPEYHSDGKLLKSVTYGASPLIQKSYLHAGPAVVPKVPSYIQQGPSYIQQGPAYIQRAPLATLAVQPSAYFKSPVTYKTGVIGSGALLQSAPVTLNNGLGYYSGVRAVPTTLYGTVGEQRTYPIGANIATALSTGNPALRNPYLNPYAPFK